MKNKDLVLVLQEYKQAKDAKAKAEATIKKIQAKIITHMTSRGTQEIKIGAFKVTYSQFPKTSIDTEALRQAKPDIYAQFSKTASSSRFTVSMIGT